MGCKDIGDRKSRVWGKDSIPLRLTWKKQVFKGYPKNIGMEIVLSNFGKTFCQ